MEKTRPPVLELRLDNLGPGFGVDLVFFKWCLEYNSLF